MIILFEYMHLKVNYTSCRGIISRLYKELRKQRIKKKDDPIKTLGV